METPIIGQDMYFMFRDGIIDHAVFCRKIRLPGTVSSVYVLLDDSGHEFLASIGMYDTTIQGAHEHYARRKHFYRIP